MKPSAGRKQPSAQRSAKPQTSPTKTEKSFSIVLLAQLAIAAGTVWFSVTELWGISVGYYSKSTDVFAILAIFGGAAAYAQLKRNTGKVWQQAGALKYWLASVVLAGIAAAAALMWRTAFAFLGDGAMYIGEVYRILSDHSYHGNLAKPTTWLGGVFVTTVARMLPVSSAESPFVFAGAAAALILWLGLAIQMRKESLSALFLMTSFIAGSGAILLFFGYVELYVLGFAFSMLYFIAAWKSFRGNCSPIPAGIFLLLAIASAIPAAVFIPSFLVLLHWKYKGTGGKPDLRISAIILAILPAALLIPAYLILGGANAYLIPVTPLELTENGISMGVQSYSLFSLQHLLDIGNILLLNGGIAFLVVLWGFFNRANIDFRQPVFLFALTAAAGACTLIVFGNTTFGMGRDWDIMTIPATAILFFGWLIVMHFHEKKAIMLAPLLPAIFVASFAQGYFWLKTNVENEPSAERFTSLLGVYSGTVAPVYTFNGLENLRKYYHSRKNTPRYLETLRSMAELRYNKLYHYREYMGVLQSSAGAQYAGEGFAWLFESLLQSASAQQKENRFDYISKQEYRAFTVHALVTALEAGYGGLAAEYIPKFKPLFGDWKELLIFEALEQAPNDPSAQYAIAGDVGFESLEDISLIIIAGDILRKSGHFNEAAVMYEKALGIDPHQYQQVYILLAQVYYRGLNDIDKTTQTLRRCIKNCAGSPAATQAASVLSKLYQRR